MRILIFILVSFALLACGGSKQPSPQLTPTVAKSVKPRDSVNPPTGIDCVDNNYSCSVLIPLPPEYTPILYSSVSSIPECGTCDYQTMRGPMRDENNNPAPMVMTWILWEYPLITSGSLQSVPNLIATDVFPPWSGVFKLQYGLCFMLTPFSIGANASSVLQIINQGLQPTGIGGQISQPGCATPPNVASVADVKLASVTVVVN